uniref:TRF2/HOY1 PH-like domain-containing protein n=1 Tax=Ananas comosus var. bracteatus TaxID=296719 RepID=A0A6V7PB22_ANACO|nr:unnamed protein product [Ananas comosus var. bracteatus]
MAEDDDKPSPSGRPDAAASATTPPQPETEAAESKADDRLNEEHGSPNQRFDIRNVSSTLGLHLTKSQSLLDSIQRTLDEQANAAASVTNDGNSVTGKKRKAMPNNGNGTPDRLKASNFPAKRLTIGDWSFTSKYESDLMAKIYFAKRKLVWEVLDSGGLKNKMEIRWSDISAIKATYPEDGLGTLDVALARRPFFFRETDPQPRRHTVWQSTADFTGGRASTYRRHFLECPSDLLSKNFGKLFQFDAKLNILSQQGATILDSPDELQCLNFEDQVEPQMCNVPKILDKYYAHSCIFADPQFGSTSMFQLQVVLERHQNLSHNQSLYHDQIGEKILPAELHLAFMFYQDYCYWTASFSPTNTQTVEEMLSVKCSANSSSDAGDDGPPTAISREEESHEDLLTQIPRVASMPQIFRLTSEDSDNRVT